MPNKTSKPKRLRNRESPHRPTGNDIAGARRNPPLRSWSAPELAPRVLWPSRSLGPATRGPCVRCGKVRFITNAQHGNPGRCLECLVVVE